MSAVITFMHTYATALDLSQVQSTLQFDPGTAKIVDDTKVKGDIGGNPSETLIDLRNNHAAVQATNIVNISSLRGLAEKLFSDPS